MNVLSAMRILRIPQVMPQPFHRPPPPSQDAIDLEALAAQMPLCPARLPDDAPEEAQELLSTVSSLDWLPWRRSPLSDVRERTWRFGAERRLHNADS